MIMLFFYEVGIITRLSEPNLLLFMFLRTSNLENILEVYLSVVIQWLIVLELCFTILIENISTIPYASVIHAKEVFVKLLLV